MKNVPRNNAALNPIIHYLSALEALRENDDPTKPITKQESQGQAELVQSEVLPIKINHPRDIDAKARLTELGFIFGDKIPDDDLFQEVTLPSGWKMVPTDHSLWSKVVDDQGRERISIFYKAACYDREAFMNINLDVV